MAIKYKMRQEYSFVSDPEKAVTTTFAMGQVVEGEDLKLIKKRRPDLLVPAEEEIEIPEDEGRTTGHALSEPEKPAKAKDEDPKDPDKSKDAIRPKA